MDNLRVTVSKICPGGDATKFWQASTVLLDHPHTINRRIAVSTKLLHCEPQATLEDTLQCLKIIDFSSIHDAEHETNFTQMLMDLLNVCQTKSQGNRIYLRIAKLLPRDASKFSRTLEIAIVDRSTNRLTYFYKTLEKDKRTLGTTFVWSLKWDDDSRLSLQVAKEAQDSTWLDEQVFPKFLKWMTNDATVSPVTRSLNLVELEKYAVKYNVLKNKYGTEMVKIWPENTDPMKFVYEDVSIATYLLLLWENERKVSGAVDLQSFVDIGCGNGLLVHILASEGHPGFGIDLRARKIWNMFPATTKLEVRTIIPSSANLFPDVDWIIGNHSDELTPWIPVIASRSSYKCRFFLLPCCAYEFDGTKYQRNDSSVSQYHEYMEYVRSICESCGFETQVDRLRIPSTKRICFVGSNRSYTKDKHMDQEIKVQEIIHKRSSGEKTEPWSLDFKPREVVERVRNCTKIDKVLISEIIKVIAESLLKQTHMINANGKEWNAGGSIDIKNAVSLLNVNQLKQLKKECGGLQTLLKNNSHVFQTSAGKVRLRNPLENKFVHGKSKKMKIQIIKKVKPCWFHANHPNGCPLADEVCNFKHESALLL